MNDLTQTMDNETDTLGEDAQALLTATAEVAGQKVAEARKRLAAALERGKEICSQVREQAVESAKVADKKIRKNPYQAIGIAVGVGAILGYLVSRRCSRNE